MNIQRVSGDYLDEGHELYVVTLGSKPSLRALETVTYDKSGREIPSFNELIDRLLDAGELGMDTEWKPVYKGQHIRQSLLQLSGRDLTVLIQIGKARRLTKKLCQVLEDRNIRKYGCGIGEDAKILGGRYKIKIAGLVELERAADKAHRVGKADLPRKSCGYNREGLAIMKGPRGLLHLYNQVMGTDLPKKDKSITMSDWSRECLTEDQIRYAALDSIMGYKIGVFLRRL